MKSLFVEANYALAPVIWGRLFTVAANRPCSAQQISPGMNGIDMSGW